MGAQVRLVGCAVGGGRLLGIYVTVYFSEVGNRQHG